MLYLIGIGISGEKDLSVRGLEAAKQCGEVYAELYTSRIDTDAEKLSELIGKEVTLLDRKAVEESDALLKNAKETDVALLVGGDPMAATTHAEIVLRCRKQGVKVRIIHSSSILTAVGETGLQLYNFGKVITLAIPEKNYEPVSPYQKILENKKAGLHSLILLDVKPDRSMTANEAIEVLEKMEGKLGAKLFLPETKVIIVCRAGSDNQKIFYGTLQELKPKNFGKPQHCLVLPGKLHFLEEEFLNSL